MSGEGRHSGALLAPFGIRFVVAGSDDLPAAVVDRLASQLDLDRVSDSDLTVYRNARAFPDASTMPADDRVLDAARSAEPLEIAALPGPRGSRALRPAPGGWQGNAPADGASFAYVADQFAPGWRLTAGGSESGAERAFGWAMGFRVAADANQVRIRFTDQWFRTLEMVVLGLLWLAVLWVTRKPVSST